MGRVEDSGGTSCNFCSEEKLCDSCSWSTRQLAASKQWAQVVTRSEVGAVQTDDLRQWSLSPQSRDHILIPAPFPIQPMDACLLAKLAVSSSTSSRLPAAFNQVLLFSRHLTDLIIMRKKILPENSRTHVHVAPPLRLSEGFFVQPCGPCPPLGPTNLHCYGTQHGVAMRDGRLPWHHMRGLGKRLFHLGRRWESEIAAASCAWRVVHRRPGRRNLCP